MAFLLRSPPGFKAGRSKVVVVVGAITVSRKCDGAGTKEEVAAAADLGREGWDASAGLSIGGNSREWSLVDDDGVSSRPLCERRVEAEWSAGEKSGAGREGGDTDELMVGR